MLGSTTVAPGAEAPTRPPEAEPDSDLHIDLSRAPRPDARGHGLSSDEF
jgi:hypothetical protein